MPCGQTDSMLGRTRQSAAVRPREVTLPLSTGEVMPETLCPPLASQHKIAMDLLERGQHKATKMTLGLEHLIEGEMLGLLSLQKAECV